MTPSNPNTETDNSSPQEKPSSRRVYLVDGARTPFLKARGRPGPFSPVDLAVQCGRPLLLRQPIPVDAYDQVILGCVNVVPSEMNPARIAALRLGMGEAMPAFTVQINCGSGMQSIDTAYKYIRDGDSDLILAGGTDALSHAPMVLQTEAVEWLAGLNAASSPQDYVRQLGQFSPKKLKPEISLAKGLTDPIVSLSMGQTAEVLAQQFNISRQEADEYAVSSHQRLARAQEEGWLDDEVVPAISPEGELFKHDDGVRADTSAEALAKLKAAFEPPFGQVTPGNSSQVTDGASWLILASEEAVKKYGLKPRAVLVDSEWAALDPKIMGLGPVLSSTALLKRHNAGLNDIDLWEINEAFAAQVLACMKAWADPEFCKVALGLDKPMGKLDPERLNIDGGAVAMGHPVGTSGNRIVLHLMNALHRKGVKRGIATECIGGGQSGAMLIEAV
ncbi:acetyl-CoA C-acetyltransferase [Marinobacter vulgaris]|uniref:Acetyl-CoA C-acetyltransferase n=1 Tax=Marinobacter vulgaris TaxID=1928331 RepID=A0A2V3ZPJ8_9GAMM|nr:acetyl-CoA C-acetyltransferase [Marinobacter vulgaris]PXX93711.1 acetyl-CoA C-acetyltransferase [Marinobacter vulgaris]TSJ72274.1 acetyl-CoA C-acetyltransferase [Marinobacter vulgaris]